MGGAASRRDRNVHVIIVQSQENSKLDAKVLTQTYNSQGQEFPSTHSSNYPHKDTQWSYQRHLSRGKEEEDDEKRKLKNLNSSAPIEKHSISKRSYDERHGMELAGRLFPSSSPLHPHGDHDQQTTSNSTCQDFLRHSYSNPRSSLSGTTNAEDNTSGPRCSGPCGNHESNRGVAGEELSIVSEKAGNLFELFQASDGAEYTVYVRDDGKRFYVDFEEQKWRFFPDSWYERGNFKPIDYDPYQGVHSGNNVRSGKLTDNLKGEFIHPTRGKLSTHLKQEMLNVLYFFDEGSSTWLPMPLSWERHMSTIATVISEIQRTCLDWRDGRDIVAMLRMCDYNIDECTSSYMAIQDDGVLDYLDHGPGNDPSRSLTDKKLQESDVTVADPQLKEPTITATECHTILLSEEKFKNKELSSRLEQLQAKVEELESDNTRMRKEISSGKEEQRRKSRVLSQQFSQSINFGHNSAQLEIIRPLVHIMGEESRTLKAKYTSFRNMAIKGLIGYAASLLQLSEVVTKLVAIHRRQVKEVGEVKLLYRKEVMQRRLLFNEVQELRGNIRVFCRCRYDNRGRCGLKFQGEEVVICTTAQGRKKVYEFERVYHPDTTQEKVFEDTRPTIMSCADGYNVCIIAYGQTGAGKTYTMMGPPDNVGVNLRSMRELFKLCRERSKIKYTIKVCMVEIYNEAVYDLLAAPANFHEKLTIQKRGKEVIIPGLTELEVRGMQDILMVLQEGDGNRTVASTKMNTYSSRSHLLFTLKVEGFDTISRATSKGCLTLVDLAGSERISRSEASGIRLVEAAAINKSLSALGQVLASIRNGALHVPYRNSKLTHLLQPCIGGDSKACIFVNVSPLEENMAETISTLEFGTNARQVELGKATKHVIT